MSLSFRTTAFSIALLGLVLSATSLALAQAESATEGRPTESPALELDVTEDRCSGLDTKEVERLLQIELAVVAARAERPRSPTVRLTCQNRNLEIVVVDKATGVVLTRTLPAPAPNEEGRERLVALGASQLFLGSWLAVVVEGKEPPPEPEPAPQAEQDTTPPPSPQPAAEEPVPRAPSVAPAPAARGAQINAELGAGLRSWQTPLPTLRAALWGEVPWQRASLGLVAAWEGGQSEQQLGRLEVNAIETSLTAGYLLARSVPFELDAGVKLGGVRVVARGVPSSDASGGRATGIAGHVGSFLRATYVAGNVVIFAKPELGWTWPELSARSHQEEALVWSGLWTALSLGIGFRTGDAEGSSAAANVGVSHE